MVLQKVKRLFFYFVFHLIAKNLLWPEKEERGTDGKCPENKCERPEELWRELRHFHASAVERHQFKHQHNFMLNWEELIFQGKLYIVEQDIKAELDMATSEIMQPPGTLPGPWSFTFCHCLISLQEQVHYLLVLWLLYLQSLFGQDKKKRHRISVFVYVIQFYLCHKRQR